MSLKVIVGFKVSLKVIVAGFNKGERRVPPPCVKLSEQSDKGTEAIDLFKLLQATDGLASLICGRTPPPPPAQQQVICLDVTQASKDIHRRL